MSFDRSGQVSQYEVSCISYCVEEDNKSTFRKGSLDNMGIKQNICKSFFWPEKEMLIHFLDDQTNLYGENDWVASKAITATMVEG